MKERLTVLIAKEEEMVEVKVSVRGFETFSLCSVVHSIEPGGK